MLTRAEEYPACESRGGTPPIADRNSTDRRRWKERSRTCTEKSLWPTNAKHVSKSLKPLSFKTWWLLFCHSTPGQQWIWVMGDGKTALSSSCCFVFFTNLMATHEQHTQSSGISYSALQSGHSQLCFHENTNPLCLHHLSLFAYIFILIYKDTQEIFPKIVFPA